VYLGCVYVLAGRMNVAVTLPSAAAAWALAAALLLVGRSRALAPA